MKPTSADARERLTRLGPGALSNKELLGLVWAPQAEAVLEERGLAALARLGTPGLRAAGLPAGAAAALCSAFELGRRAPQSELPATIALRSPRVAYEYLRPRIAHLPKEVFVVLLLNVRLRLLREERVAEGSDWACAIRPRDALAAAVREGAAAVVFAHNHPSGDPTPSGEDRALTQRLLEASAILGIRAVDHLVVCERAYASLRELGLIHDGGPASRAADKEE